MGETSTRPSVIVLQIQVCDRPILNVEGDPPVAGGTDAPGPSPVAGQPMDAPARRPLNAVHVSRADEGGQDAPYPYGQVGPDSPGVVIFNKTSQPPVADASK